VPSISMFDSVTFGLPTGRSKTVPMTVSGPLTFDDPKAYALPIAISFAVFQSPEGEHRFSKAKRAGGIATVEKLDGTWEGVAQIKHGLFHDGEARLIAVAVMPRRKTFAYETLTWCMNFTLTKTGFPDPSAPPSGR
jgi:hypothetical protein